MNTRLPALLAAAADEGFHVYAFNQIPRGKGWSVVLQYPSKRYEHTLFSVTGRGDAAQDAFEMALKEGREMTKKHGFTSVAPSAPSDPSLEDLLG